MSMFRVQLHNTSNALTFRMSGEQIRLQVAPKLFGINSWIAQGSEFQTVSPASIPFGSSHGRCLESNKNWEFSVPPAM